MRESAFCALSSLDSHGTATASFSLTTGEDDRERPDARTGNEGYMANLELKLRGYRLTTAEILYRMPDHPAVLQTFIWQELDIAPEFPVLNKFLHFWETSIEGRLHSVRVAARGLISDADLKMAAGEFSLQ
jgi:uncharacterized protein Usg